MNGTVVAAGAILLLMAVPPGAAHAAEAVTMGLSYEADGSCPDGPSFAAMVGDRAASVALAPAPAERADVIVALRQENGLFRGTLRIRRSDGNDYLREMQGTTCDELGSALAFVAALALSAREQGHAAREEPGANDAPARADRAEPTAPLAPTDTGWSWGATIGLGIRFGIAPTWANTEQFEIETGPAAASFVAPVFRLGVVHAEPVTRIERVGTTTFNWTTVRAAGCPLRVGLVGKLEVRPCVGLGWGVIGAAGVPSTPRGTANDDVWLWADVFVALRSRVHIWRPFWAVGEAELAASLTPYDFAFDPDTPVYAVPPVAAAGFAGLSAQIP
jgi:hypothetical protein